jgi:hypothetical protein
MPTVAGIVRTIVRAIVRAIVKIGFTKKGPMKHEPFILLIFFTQTMKANTNKPAY